MCQLRANSLKDTKAMENIVKAKKNIKNIKLMMACFQNQQENSFNDSYAAVIKSRKNTAQRRELCPGEFLTAQFFKGSHGRPLAGYF